jgi:hypothetical protein
MPARLTTVFFILPVFAIALVMPRADDPAKTYPKHVLILRHAEKPPDEAMSPDLSQKGKERALALRGLFEKSDGRPDPFPVPDFLFASKDSNRSHRPTETIAPLAKKLGLKVNDTYPNEDYAKLAHELFHDPKYAGKTVLICWHHGRIPELAGRLKAKGAPSTWDPTVFDRVWRIDYDAEGKARFRNLPQRLLAGDSES